MTAVATSEPDQLAEIRRSVTENPLAAAPSALRHSVWRVWCLHQHLFPSPLPIAGALGTWVREQGLPEADALKILAAMLKPERMRSFKFASDLMTDLCDQVAEVLHQRRQVEEQLRRREEVEKWRSEAVVNQPKLSEFLGSADDWAKMPDVKQR